MSSSTALPFVDALDALQDRWESSSLGDAGARIAYVAILDDDGNPVGYVPFTSWAALEQEFGDLDDDYTLSVQEVWTDDDDFPDS